eukprot:NODE_4701_length_1128_cov_11.772139_g4168_i0.p1 GENE.NODE_4701_length_1128_cov_11.772139_g4168_i0~~NODE_4701_length_1128_cov_11.772139_g4168_i0.p1  ORF type:complete len:342 (-),score=53.87 NODE_4701_length_1128_cov_11.772139_g4168_i0:101-1078(-)
MSAVNKNVICFVGRTGDGKSASANTVSKTIGGGEPFSESSGSHSHTHLPNTITIGENILVDYPGLLDSAGVEKDERNLTIIVDHSKQLGHINALILVINENVCRFDSGMQDALKLFVDSFGSDIISHIGILFTNSCGIVSNEESAQRLAEITNILSDRLNLPISHFASWRIECRPEKLRNIGVSEDKIEEIRRRNDIAVGDLIRWSNSRRPLSTEDAVYGEYEERRRAREAEYNATVIMEETEKRVREESRQTTPLFRQETRSKEVWKGGVGKMLGKKRTIEWTEQVHYGNKVTLKMCEDTRLVKTLGNGEKIFGEWTIKRSWEE